MNVRGEQRTLEEGLSIGALTGRTTRTACARTTDHDAHTIKSEAPYV